MSTREMDLLHLHSYIEGMDKEITMILQSLQWDQKHLLENIPLLACKQDSGHKVPPDKKKVHEMECVLRCQGYTGEDILLPDPVDPSAPTLVKLSKNDIDHLIHLAARSDPLFKKGPGSKHPPLTAERVQATYSADERRAIHDAVVSAMPDSWHGEDILLPSEGGSGEGVRRRKSKLEVLAELRDMRRRRVRYRGNNTASRNYSHVIRDLIKTQMEVYTGLQGDDMAADVSNCSPQIDREEKHNKDINKDDKISRDRYRNSRDDCRGDTRNEKRKERSRSNDRQRYVEQRHHKNVSLKNRHSDIHDRHKRENTSETFFNIKSSEIKIKREIDEYTEYGDDRENNKEHRDSYNNGDAKKYKSNKYDTEGSSSTKSHREQNFPGDSRNRNERVHRKDKYDERRQYPRDDRADFNSVKIEKHEVCSSSRSKHGEYIDKNAYRSGNERAHNSHTCDERASSSSKRYHERSDRDYNEGGHERTHRTDKYGESVSFSRKRHREDKDRGDSDSPRKAHCSHRHEYDHDHKRTQKSDKHKKSSDSSAKRHGYRE